MPAVGLLPAIALLAGATVGASTPTSPALAAWALAVLALSGWSAWCAGCSRVATTALTAGYVCAAIALAAHAREQALHTPLRALLDEAIGGFAIEAPGPAARHDPLRTRVLLLEDAAHVDDATTLIAEVTAIYLQGGWRDTRGTVSVAVGGSQAHALGAEWRAGRAIEAPVTFRRPSRYFNNGVADFEQDLALGGTTLFGSIKSGLLVDVIAHGSAIEEMAARLRRLVRGRVDRWVAPHDPVAAAIVTAVLIGDRSALPDRVRLRLQAAGTYHVIAISGGNIATLAALVLLLLAVFGITGRGAALVTTAALVAYAEVVTGGPSVWRATVMAVVYLAARVLDHRSPPWHALGLAAALIVCASPLEVRDAGFLLTFGATGALLEAARRLLPLASTRRVTGWLLASLAASLAAEVALLPVTAWTFSRVTSAGLLLNLVAVPIMAIAQVAGTVLVCVGSVDGLAGPAGWIAAAAAKGLVDSAGLVEAAPWLTRRVPPPALWVVGAYYAGLASTLMARGVPRTIGLAVISLAATAIVTGWPVAPRGAGAQTLRITALDVGQGDATLVEFPDGSSLLVDAGGSPFGGGRFDVGSRVVSPALWAGGIRRLDTLLLTHGDPDHIGGAPAAIEDFAPRSVWQGIPVPRHAPLNAVLDRARQTDAAVVTRHAGDLLHRGAVRLRVLHPAPTDWERPRVRNDDSVVLELLYKDVAVLLPGDIGAATERALLDQLTPARRRILKVAHHGSRTSTSQELLEHWRPQIAIISAGRDNTFGHPTRDVLDRLTTSGATIYRTDQHGQITLETNGVDVTVRTATAPGAHRP